MKNQIPMSENEQDGQLRKKIKDTLISILDNAENYNKDKINMIQSSWQRLNEERKNKIATANVILRAVEKLPKNEQANILKNQIQRLLPG